MTVRTRVHRLLQAAQERGLVVTGCPACRDRRGYCVLLTVRRGPNGEEVPDPNEPKPCRACGKVPEQIIEVVEPLATAATCA